ncbi:hypothetical protein B0H63DRAFT_462744 [Podospora didyma]|uniref:Uncharacterized protein n=1 Tax=Podospora didyma TaxID=330526 RepID=A0AAE0U8Q8_9PEZI|nr:hypothetical protein B0H63DRAFT_462744 [Podospora didyma]
MGGDEEWGTTNGTGTLAVVGLGLGKPTPLLARKLIYGGGQYIFSAEAKPGQLFMWDAETGDVQHIVDPTSLDGVKKLIAADEMNKIKYEDIPVAPTVEEREAHHETFFAAQGLTHMLRKE